MKLFCSTGKKQGILQKLPLAGLFGLLLMLNGFVSAQENLEAIQLRNAYWLKYSDAPNSLYRHISNQAYSLLEDRQKEVASINSLKGWQERQKILRETLNEIVGPFPEKTPLNARITGTIKKDGFRVEHIVFESQPGFYVTSSMYIPENRGRSKIPAVIYCSGHAAQGYRSDIYQHKITNLVKKGFIVFAFDPVGQGERLEYYDPETGRSVVGGATREHSYPGAQAFITGSSQARHMIWDGIRTVDYLMTRNEVNHEKIGITGRSGGGTQSACIAAMDDRIYAAAPEAYITSFTRLLQSIGPQDAEQNLFNGIKRGIDHADLLAVRAPKPALMITTTNDFFSIQGARETAIEISELYRSYGRSDFFSMVEDIEGHASTKKNREAMYAFFQKHLDNPGDPMDRDVEILTAEELMVTTTGQISTSLTTETVFSLNRKEAEKLIEKVERSREDPEKHIPSVIASAKRLSGYISPEETVEPVFTGRVRRDGYMIEKYFLQGEGDYVIPYLLFIPDKPEQRALIYLHPEGKAAEASPGGEIEWFVKNGFTVMAADLVGIGETGPGVFRGDSYIDGISFNVWFGSVLIGRSVTGIRAGDIVRLTRILEQKDGIESIYALAGGEISPELLHAAAFEPSIARVALIEPYSSYRSIVFNRFYDPVYIHGSVPGALGEYDLPDLAASLAPGKLMLINVVDAAAESNDQAAIAKDLSIVINAYRQKNAESSLIIESGMDMERYFSRWIAP